MRARPATPRWDLAHARNERRRGTRGLAAVSAQVQVAQALLPAGNIPTKAVEITIRSVKRLRGGNFATGIEIPVINFSFRLTLPCKV